MRRTAAAFGIAVLATGLAACGGTGRGGSREGAGTEGTGTSARDDAPAIAVEAITVARAPLAEALDAGGVVTAATTAAVSSRVMAPVVALRVRAGDHVRAGQLLVVLEDRQLAAQARQAEGAAGAAEQALAAARSQEAAALADQRLAEAWHRRVTALRAQEAATAQESDEADARLAGATARLQAVRAGIAQAEAGLDAARAGREAADTTRGYTQVTAPFEGTVTETLIEAGNLATPGAPLVRIDAAGAREVEVRVDEARIPFVTTGDRVTVLFDDAGRKGSVEGTVREVARLVASDARAFTVKVSLPATVRVPSGSFARVRFAGAPRDTLMVPASAVRRQGQVSTVFVVDGEVVRLRLVQVGRSEGARVELLAGLDAGERVVAAPGPALQDGTRVTVRPVAAGAGR